MNQSEDDSQSRSNYEEDFEQQEDDYQVNFLQSPITQPLTIQEQSPNFLEGSYLQVTQDQIDDFKLETNSQKDEDQQSQDELNSFNVSQSMKSFHNKSNLKNNEYIEDTNLDTQEQKRDFLEQKQQNEYQIELQQDNIQVKHSRVEKQVKVTHYFKISGLLQIQSEEKQFETEKRFSDFYLLDKILQNKYYYIVLPQLPSKNISILITSNNSQLNQREQDLNYYLNQMILIENIKNDNIFQIFLFQNNLFKSNQIVKQEQSIFCDDNQIFSKLFKTAQIWKKQLTIQNQIEEPYRLLVKKISTQIVYVQSIIENFLIIEKNFGYMINKMQSIYSEQQNETIIEALEKNQKYRKENQYLKKIIKKYKNLLKDLRSCKVAIEKKVEIYVQSQHIKQEVENETKNAQKLVQLQIQDEKYDQMILNIENYLLNDLLQKQELIQKQLKILSQSSIKQSFQNFFSFNQFQTIY